MHAGVMGTLQSGFLRRNLSFRLVPSCDLKRPRRPQVRRRRPLSESNCRHRKTRHVLPHPDPSIRIRRRLRCLLCTKTGSVHVVAMVDLVTIVGCKLVSLGLHVLRLFSDSMAIH